MDTSQLTPALRDYVTSRFPHTPPHALLRVDVILALLQDGRVDEAEDLAGVPIQYGTPALSRRDPHPRHTPQPPELRVVSVRVPSSPRTPVPLLNRLRAVQVGMTVPQLRQRGWTAEMIRHARNRGDLRMVVATLDLSPA